MKFRFFIITASNKNTFIKPKKKKKTMYIFETCTKIVDKNYLPGRKSAESMRSGRFVAPSTNIC